MNERNDEEWAVYSEAYGFIGNSLLKPMNQTASIGLDPAFWHSFPRFGTGEAIDAALDVLESYAEAARAVGESEGIERTAVEYTHLFVGPPSPSCPPWETMNRNDGATVGFGEPTVAMRDNLRRAGLELNNVNRQYEDHIGIELLYLSKMCERFAQERPGHADIRDLIVYIEERPLSWIGILREKVAAEAPGGYIAGLLGLAEGILTEQHKDLLETSSAV